MYRDKSTQIYSDLFIKPGNGVCSFASQEGIDFALCVRPHQLQPLHHALFSILEFYSFRDSTYKDIYGETLLSNPIANVSDLLFCHTFGDHIVS